ncbi:D-aminoacyl-tRNA deacylase [Acidaminobacter sp.]|uniref:D-aminoacyl-tRNA deacylase n=1 Tax=Acidaminobacter sp. TaxID=1872102 RepID=UPI0013815815|nr:D-aminoacyl-tRNA deacylase [Acidaminobacter sp.]MDK9712098.1 D-aminoacyl-tRNA deacylase [Acidaminobacter sp.]MZQ98457.1 D-tyrosyl-tRNA(Tyr) deacylase [Acidaminobacter sp.]
MRAVIQRVRRSSVTVDERVTGEIGHGLMVLLGVEEKDTDKDLDYMVDKIPNLRIFEDADGKMNLSLLDVSGELLVVSQFTLLGDARKGRRPGFTDAARPEMANAMYETLVSRIAALGVKVETGQFQAHMMVDILNDGPVTILLDSHKLF